MNIKSVNEKYILDEALAVLKSGGIVIYPTETCYGVGVDATSSDAVTKVLEYKKRPEGKAISIAVASEEMAGKYVEVNSVAENFYRNFLPGPVTIVSKSLKKTDPRLESEKHTLGIRIPNYKFLLDLISKFGSPITSTSANSSGKKTPYTIQDILDNISEKQKDLIGLIIDAGELPHNPPSTVIDTTTEELTIYRQGRIDPSKIKNSEMILTEDVNDTIQAGKDFMLKHISELKENPVIILLNGELGAGKTHFTKGIAQALGITQVVKSPSYNYVNEYAIQDSIQGHSKMYHFDAWRIHTLEDLHALEFHSWLTPGNIISIEWPSVIMNLDEKIFKNLKYFYVDFVIQDIDLREIKIYSFK